MKDLLITSDQPNYSKILNYVLLFFIVIAVAISVQKLAQGERTFWGHSQSHYNNYVIFKTSFKHLVDGVNLYDLYEKEYGDFYKYSPTFAVLMAPFYFIPDWLGLNIWNLINCLLLFYGVSKLPQLTSKIKVFVLLFSTIELITSVQNQQSNAMIVGLLLLAFMFFEKQKIPIAALLIMLCFYVKLTGILAGIIFLFYDKKLKFILWSALWLLLLGALPLLVTNMDNLIHQYQNWFKLLAEDHLQSYGISIFGIIHSWFSIEPSKNLILLGGLLVFLLPLIRTKHYKEFQFRLLFICSLLIWIVIFNHKAESSSYIVAIVGCAIWFFSSKKSNMNIALIVMALVFISLSPTDIFPRFVRDNFIVTYTIKALPAVLIFFKIVFELIFENNKSDNSILAKE